ncbi:hypothetical protein C6502_16110 [Candidatus Poribacteria bacterium]|nr:MAG: hypothetical protein C6502_16110 [Candidatus Poribacteria bacterium]
MLRFLSILSMVFISLLFSSDTQGFIYREFTIQEIIDGSTNIAFGKIKSVDTKRMNAIIEVEEDLKGQKLDQIKLNIATGWYVRGSSPQKMIDLLKVGMPLIVFYQQTYVVEALGYFDGTWYRNRTRDPKGWWVFTHLCPYMERTFDGTTMEFREVIRAILAGERWVGAPEDALKILTLTGNTEAMPSDSPVPVPTNTVSYEYNAIRSVRKVGNRTMAYEATQDPALPGLDEVDILWLGHREIAYSGYLLNEVTEKKIKRFVENGGIVIVSGQDADREEPFGIGWLAGSLSGIERKPTQEFAVTEQGQKLFAEPNEVQPGQLYVDDTWTDWDGDFQVLATSNDGKDLVVGVRKHGKGLYIITSLRNDNQYTVERNRRLIENILHYAASQVQ